MTGIRRITLIEAFSKAAEVSKNGFASFPAALKRSFAVRDAINKMAKAGRTQEDVDRIIDKVKQEYLDDYRSREL